MTDLTITINEQARDTIRACGRQAEAIEVAWRTTKPELATKAHVSLSRNLARLLHGTYGATTQVFRDGDGGLSLYVTTPVIVFGMIFHRTHRADPPQADDIQSGFRAPLMGRYCMHSDKPGTYCASPVINDKATCEGHNPVVYAYPVPGEWSFHS